MQIGCCVPMDQYEAAVRAGYAYVEFPAWEVEALPPEALAAAAETLRRLGVPCLRLNAYCRGVPAIVGEGADAGQAASYAQRLMEKAAVLGAACVGVGAPPARRLPEGYDRDLADRQCEAFLRITAQAAAPYGIQVLVEAIQQGMCSYMNRTEEALDMVRRVDLENVGLVVDLYHMETQGEDWSALGRYLPWTRHLHVSTVGEGLRRGLYGPGDEALCARTFRAILDSGYDGTVSLEPDAAELTPAALETALRIMRRSCGAGN